MDDQSWTRQGGQAYEEEQVIGGLRCRVKNTFLHFVADDHGLSSPGGPAEADDATATPTAWPRRARTAPARGRRTGCGASEPLAEATSSAEAITPSTAVPTSEQPPAPNSGYEHAANMSSRYGPCGSAPTSHGAVYSPSCPDAASAGKGRFVASPQSPQRKAPPLAQGRNGWTAETADVRQAGGREQQAHAPSITQPLGQASMAAGAASQSSTWGRSCSSTGGHGGQLAGSSGCGPRHFANDVGSHTQIGMSQQPQTLRSCQFSDGRGMRVDWTVDARKLDGNDQQVVSPAIWLTEGPGQSMRFKLMIGTTKNRVGRRISSFKKAMGRGRIVLKCEGDYNGASRAPRALELSLQWGIARRYDVPGGALPFGLRGPVRHNFSERAVCGLPPGQDEWDFSSVVDVASQTFVVLVVVSA